MKITIDNFRRVGFTGAALAAAALLLGAATASAAVGPRLEIDSLSSTTAQPGAEDEYLIQIANSGDQSISGEVTLTGALPAGMKAVSGLFYVSPNFGAESFECTDAAGEPLPSASDPTHIRCTHAEGLEAPAVAGGTRYQLLQLRVEVEPGALGATLTPTFTVAANGGALSATTVDPTPVTESPPGFGIDAFDSRSLDGAGEIEADAGSHPAALVTSFDFNTFTNPIPYGGPAWPVAPARDAFVDLPPGSLGNPNGLERCTVAQIANGGTDMKPLCPSSSQLGTVVLRMDNGLVKQPSYGPLPVFNLDAPVGAPARFGVNIIGTVVVIDASVRSDGDYGITANSENISAALPIAGASFEFWGVPGDESHDLERACPGEFAPSTGGSHCQHEGAEPAAFLRSPTSCAGPQKSSIHADSWFEPGVFDVATSISHQGPGYPYPPSEWGAQQGFENCAAEPFDPALAGGPPSGALAGEPTSVSFDLSMPQQGLEDPEAISESDLRSAVVTLPAGLRVNPSSADGLGACSPAQIGLTTPVGQADAHFTNDAGNCPENAKIGNLEITTPLLDHKVPGSVYLATPQQNPFGSFLALYLIASDPISGVNLKLPGKVTLDPNTGQITTSFENNPQLPFTNLHLALKSGPRAALSAPTACGNYTTHSTFGGWSGKVVSGDSSFTIGAGCVPQGFDPKLAAGTQNPLAGHYSPFAVRLTRTDSDQEFSAITVKMPPGLTGRLAAIPYCPQAAIDAATAKTALGTGAGELASPSCPPPSQVGTVSAGAGAGGSPFFLTTGRAYLAGPYKGAPLSLFTEVPVVAGPFDLGVTVDRIALNLDPESARITATSDPLPAALQGIPLQIRDIRVEANRPGFTLNPTSCEPFSVDSTITSTQGASAHPSSRFQAAGCDRLKFKPKLTLKLKGKTKRSGHPALTAVLRARPGDANIASVSAALPHSEFLAQSHIRTICTRVQFAAGNGGGEGCPKGSVYGHVTATSPLVDYPLTGNVYLRSSSHPLPDLVMALRGPAAQPLEIDAVGRIDSVGGGIRATFASVPDAPLSKVVLRMQGGKKGLLENSRNICRTANKAAVQMDGQNGKTYDFAAPLRAKCGGKRAKHKR